MKKKDIHSNPIDLNKEYTVDILDMTEEGSGVGKIDGFTVFVDGCVTGDTVVTEIIKKKSNYCTGRLKRISKLSHCRVKPMCEYFGRCGGCTLQNMDYESQLELKLKRVRDALQRIGGLAIPDSNIIRPVIGLEYPYFYRNKAQFPVGFDGGQTISGFYSKKSRKIVDVNECCISNKRCSAIKNIVTDFMRTFNVPPYDESSRSGLVRHIIVKLGFNNGEAAAMVLVVINGSKLPHQDKLIDMLTQNGLLNVESIILNFNTSNTEVILGRTYKFIYGASYITDTIGNLQFRISPSSFYQVNPIQTKILYGKVIEYACLSGNETVLDIYSGVGTISLFAAGHAKHVTGVEISHEACKTAKQNAEDNNISNVEFIAGDASVVLSSYDAPVDVVFLDPPRNGCDPSLLKELKRLEADKVIYVSCNPATLARDLKALCGAEGGKYNIEAVQPVDMFAQTGHVECVVLLRLAQPLAE